MSLPKRNSGMRRPAVDILINVICVLKLERFLSRTTLAGHQNITPENFTTPFNIKNDFGFVNKINSFKVINLNSFNTRCYKRMMTH